jgi:hypothetical protein
MSILDQDRDGLIRTMTLYCQVGRAECVHELEVGDVPNYGVWRKVHTKRSAVLVVTGE